MGAHPEHILSSRANKSEKIDFWYFYQPIQILGHLSRESIVKTKVVGYYQVSDYIIDF